MCVTLRYQGSVAQTLDNVSVEDFDYVWDKLHMKFPHPGKYKEGLVFEVFYYVPEQVGSFKDRAEFVAKAIVELQKFVPIEGMLHPVFPERVDRKYLKQVCEFLSSRGKSWVEDMLQPASTPLSDIAGTSSVPLAGQQMAERIGHPPLYAPVGHNAVASTPEAGLNGMTMSPVSTTSVSDCPSSLVPDISRVRGPMSERSDTGGKAVAVGLGQASVRRMPLYFCLVVCFVAVSLWILSS